MGRSSFTILLMIQFNPSQANWPAHITMITNSRVCTARDAYAALHLVRIRRYELEMAHHEQYWTESHESQE